MELLRECLLNKMPVNQGDAAGEFEAQSELEADEVQKWIKKIDTMNIIKQSLITITYYNNTYFEKVDTKYWQRNDL